MSTLAATPTRTATRPDADGTSLLVRPLVVVLVGFAMSLILSWPRVVEIWRDNTFFDTDDAMRLVQVRDWLAGQEWFDLVAHRLAPPGGLLMHWSRIVDVPIAALIRFFELFVPNDPAERLARIVFPLLLQIGLIAVMAAVVRMLLGVRAMLIGVVLLVLSGFSYEQFPPGRIDHHAPQIILLLAMTGTILSALHVGRGWHAAIAAACLAVSFGISLENMPFAVVIAAVLPLAWVVDPARARPALLWFSAGLASAAVAVYAATVPPSRYGALAYDAFTLPQLAALLACAVTFAMLAALAGRVHGVLVRTAVLAVVAAASGGLLLLFFPGLAHDPYAGMDPLLQSIWLSHVTEAQPLLAASRARPDTFTMLACPILCGALGAAVAAWRERGLPRACWLAILALIVVGFAGTCWEIRVACSTQPLAALGGAWVVAHAFAWAKRRTSPAATLLAALATLPFGTLAWAFVPTGDGDVVAAAALVQGQACRTSAALAPLATLPAGLVFAPIDDGAHLLVATPHAVLAGPYHRNIRGNRTVIDAFMAPPAEAEAIVRRSGARYLAVCPGEVQIGTLAQAAPRGLAAALVAGDAPPWLIPVHLEGTPYRVFALAPAE